MSHEKTYRSFYAGGDRWGVWSDDSLLAPCKFIDTKELQPAAYAIERWVYGQITERYITSDKECLRKHLDRLSELMDEAPESFADKDFCYIAEWCKKHDLELAIFTY
ncbi:MAG: hypothetical protein IKF75_05115 [Lachnospiraceae bacterium]|nr:hypothetical protein [Lachnospiraceae bacterium]